MMKVNLLICVRLVEMVSVVLVGWLNVCMMKNVVVDLLNMMMVIVVSICYGCCMRMLGLNSMLIEMKNSIVNVLCSGSELCVVLWFSFDLLSSILVKNVFSVNEMLNSIVELNVMFSVIVSMDRVNSLCELVLVMCFRIYGMIWCLIISIIVMNRFSCMKVQLMLVSMLFSECDFFVVLGLNIFVIIGIIISVSMQVRFFMISQLIVILLCIVFSRWCFFIVCNSMMVLVVVSEKLKMMLWMVGQFISEVMF